MERELRLRAEAKARMEAKFGKNGLKGNKQTNKKKK